MLGATKGSEHTTFVDKLRRTSASICMVTSQCMTKPPPSLAVEDYATESYSMRKVQPRPIWHRCLLGHGQALMLTTSVRVSFRHTLLHSKKQYLRSFKLIKASIGDQALVGHVSWLPACLALVVACGTLYDESKYLNML